MVVSAKINAEMDHTMVLSNSAMMEMGRTQMGAARAVKYRANIGSVTLQKAIGPHAS
jgi:hypothetical protein